MTSNSLLYTAEIEHPIADVLPFIEWYAYRHAPDLFKLGFKSCASYRAVEGGMNLLDIYDMDSSDVFETAAYRDMSEAKDPYVKRVMGNAITEAATIYTQRMVSGGEGGAIPLIDADWISMIRFEAPAEADADIMNWLEEEEGARQIGLGATSLRYGWRSYNHPTLSTVRPRCVVLAEWPDRPAARLDGIARKFGDRITAVDIYVGYRAYPWPDRPFDAPSP